MFAQLKRMGVRISLGDVGAGFSSLSREVVELILGLGRSLGVQVVAEGVETDLQADRLLKLGCEFAQGYFVRTAA